MFKSKSTNRARRSRKRASAKENRCGIAAVEMAFVAPFVLLLVFTSVEFSRMMMVRQALTNAAREGCRHASLVTTQSDTDVDTIIRDRLGGVIIDADDSDTVRIGVTPAFTTSLNSGQTITVTVEVDCADVSFLPPFFFADAVIFSQSSINRE